MSLYREAPLNFVFPTYSPYRPLCGDAGCCAFRAGLCWAGLRGTARQVEKGCGGEEAESWEGKAFELGLQHRGGVLGRMFPMQGTARSGSGR